MRTDRTGRVEIVKRGQRGSRIRFVRAIRREVVVVVGGVTRRRKDEGRRNLLPFPSLASGDMGVGWSVWGGMGCSAARLQVDT